MAVTSPSAVPRPGDPLPGTAGTHEAHVARMFGPKASAYVASEVHAKGEDLVVLGRFLEERAPGRVLDLGCGGGHVSFAAAAYATEVVAYDLSSDMLAVVAGEAARRGFLNIATRQGVAEVLPFPAESFDLVASRYSAHHWRDVRAGVREARRVLKSHGHAIFMDVVSPKAPLCDTFLQAVELLRDPSHVRDYGEGEWREVLKEAGFRLVDVTPRRLRLEFASWVKRIGAPQTHVAAIRSLQASAPLDVRRHFALEEDGSFTVDTLSLVVRPA